MWPFTLALLLRVWVAGREEDAVGWSRGVLGEEDVDAFAPRVKSWEIL